MKLKQLYASKAPVISFEFFPPKTEEGHSALMETVRELRNLGPDFVSMTYGAGGSTREATVDLVSKIKSEIGLETVAHLACGGHTKSEIRSILKALADRGVENILALRGDPPKGQTGFPPVADGFQYAVELVSLIKSEFSFGVGVAGYPEMHIEAKDPETDLRHLKEKVDAGAEVIITQLFFDNADYFSFVNRARALGITVPIVAGIMPIKDVAQIKRFTAMCGAQIPSDLLKKLEAVEGNPEEVVAVGAAHASAQCKELLQKGAPGIHFYTLNRSRSTLDIFKELKRANVVPTQNLK